MVLLAAMNTVIIQQGIFSGEVTLRVINTDKTKVRNLTAEEFLKVKRAIDELELEQLINQNTPFHSYNDSNPFPNKS